MPQCPHCGTTIVEEDGCPRCATPIAQLATPTVASRPVPEPVLRLPTRTLATLIIVVTLITTIIFVVSLSR